jgi:putative hydrolase of the HAD superfamily
MEGLEAVAFDFYGTLAVQNQDEAAVDAAILTEHGCVVDDTLLMRWIDPVTAPEHPSESQSASSYEDFCVSLWRDLLLGGGVAAGEVDGLIEQARARGRARQLVPFEDSVSSLLALRAAGLRLAICSNWGWELPAVVHDCGLPDVFDVVLSSAEAGYRKPHPRIFETLVDRLDVDAGAVLFVGDSQEADVGGASSAGLKAVQLSRVAAPVSRPGGSSGVSSGVVSSLGSLVELVTSGSRRRETA